MKVEDVRRNYESEQKGWILDGLDPIPYEVWLEVELVRWLDIFESEKTITTQYLPASVAWLVRGIVNVYYAQSHARHWFKWNVLRRGGVPF